FRGVSQPAARASLTKPNSRRMRSGGMSRVQYHRPLRERRSQECGTATSSVRTASMRPPWRQATCIAAQLGVAKLEQGLREPTWVTVQALAKALVATVLDFVVEDGEAELRPV